MTCEVFGILSRRPLKTHCYRGHAYTPENTPENTLLESRGYRCCKRCARLNGSARLKKFRARKAAEPG